MPFFGNFCLRSTVKMGIINLEIIEIIFTTNLFALYRLLRVLIIIMSFDLFLVF